MDILLLALGLFVWLLMIAFCLERKAYLWGGIAAVYMLIVCAQLLKDDAITYGSTTIPGSAVLSFTCILLILYSMSLAMNIRNQVKSK